MTANHETIFVQIASYRDRECQWTIRDLFAKAKYPERIFVGVCWQFVPEQDADCFLEQTRPDQVRVVEFHVSESHGLGWARQQALTLWDGEDYVLQIDSHMRFVQDWDEKMLQQLALTRAQSPVLTVYPPAYTPPNDLELSPPIRVQTPQQFNQDGILGFSAPAGPVQVPHPKPYPTAAVAGGFIFGPSAIIEKVPPDPHLYFFGEEVSLAVRLWTHGFDLFSPSETLLYHYYLREGSGKHWKDDANWQEKQRRSLARLRQLTEPANTETFQEREELGHYGLGEVRTLAQYEQFSGINFAGKTIAQHARSYPFVLTEEVTTSILELDGLRPADNLQLFIIEDQGVVFIADAGDFALLNTSATYAWCQFEEGANPKQLVQEMASLLAAPLADAERMIAGLFTHWQGLGMVSEQGAQQVAGRVSEPLQTDNWRAAVDPSCFPPLPTPHEVVASRYYQLLDCCVQVQFATEEHKSWVHPALAHLETDSGSPDHQLVTALGNTGHFFFLNEEAADSCSELSELAPLIKFALLSLATSAQDYLLNLHAGVVSDGSHCLLLPASAGSGKTTLTAALACAGYQYFSDETALLQGAACQVRPVPLALTVKTSGSDVLASRFPELGDLKVHARADGKRVQYAPPPEQTMASGDTALPVSAIIFPRYVAGVSPCLSPMSQVDTLAGVFEHSVSFKGRLRKQDAVALIN